MLKLGKKVYKVYWHSLFLQGSYISEIILKEKAKEIFLTWGINIKLQPLNSEKNETLFLLEDVYWYTFHGAYLCLQTECLLCKTFYEVLYDAFLSLLPII